MQRRSLIYSVIFFIFVQASFAASPAGKKPARPATTTIAARIEAILNQPQFASAEWGIHVIDAATGRPIYSLNAGRLFVPASNNKLLTTSAAFGLVGGDYRFRTTVETSGSLDDQGRLTGDLVLLGRGDPNISGRTLPYQTKTERLMPSTWVLDEMADQIEKKGIRAVEGDVVGDDSYYSAQRFPEGWAHDDLQWGDGAPISALSFNDNVVVLAIRPGEQAGDKAIIETDPLMPYYEIDNRVVTSEAGLPRKIGLHREPGTMKVIAWGTISAGAQPLHEALAIEDPAEFTARLFREILVQRGITVSGRAYARHDEIARFFDAPAASRKTARAVDGVASSVPSPDARIEAPAEVKDNEENQRPVLAEHLSMPLLEDLRVINKTSQNLHAELVLRLVARTVGTGASVEGSVSALTKWLQQAGVNETDFYLQDGSGLSRRDLISPAAMVQVLAYSAKQPWGAAFEETLPVAATDGSLAERFLNSPAAGLVHAKTGTLGHVNALSGYGQTLAGKKFIFSIFCNNHNQPSSKVTAAIDAIVGVLVQRK